MPRIKRWITVSLGTLRGWLPLLVLPLAAVLLTPAWPRWAFMWLLAFTLYAGCKWLTWRRTPAPAASWGRHLAYLLAWPGLDAPTFLDPAVKPSRQPAPREWTVATAKTLLGLALVFGVARLVPEDWPLARGWVGMVGIVMFLHFGLFHLLSCLWRSRGIEAVPLMHAPLASVSVSEFWGRRWNLAFRDLTHRFLFRPLTHRLGPRAALAIGFIFSGLIHDLVISVPAGAGYGLPTLFFLIQGLAIFGERSKVGRKLGLGRGWRGWLFTTVVLLAPVRLLFHRAFVLEIVVPFLQALGGL
jgi:alginate O-acetyltransferase complex protein AlgI